jgi:hypothetical protein
MGLLYGRAGRLHTKNGGFRPEQWAGLEQLAAGRSLPPKAGDVWRMDFSRFN